MRGCCLLSFLQEGHSAFQASHLQARIAAECSVQPTRECPPETLLER